MIAKLPKNGFTLIELLVVVAIISLLSSIIIGSVNDARAKARDAALFETVRQIQTALELYRQKYGEYPDGSTNTSTHVHWVSRLRFDDLWYSGGGTLQNPPDSLKDKLREFLPEISVSSKFISGYILHYYAYYNGEAPGKQRSICSSSSISGPFPSYTLMFKPETNSFNNLQTALWTDNIDTTPFKDNHATVGNKCVTVE